MNAKQLKNSILQDLIHPKEGWIKIELKDIVDPQCPISYGIVQQGENVENGVPVVRPVDLHNEYVRRIGLKCTTKEISNSYSRTILRGDEILLCVRGTTGIIGLASEEIKGCNVNRGIVPLYFKATYYKKFVYYQMQSPLIQQAIAENTTGSALKQINIKELRSIDFYFPPLAEQKRIVAKIEELMPKVEEYGKAQEALDKLSAELPERLKKSILQEAIEGRLVPQDPNDEPASVLLERIRAEKQRLVKEGKLKKKDLIETPISDDEKPFEIPDSWEWAKVFDCINVLYGYPFDSQKFNEEGIGFPLIRIRDILPSMTKTFTTENASDVYVIKEGDMLVGMDGNFNVRFWKSKPAYLNQRVCRIKTKEEFLNQKFLYYYIPIALENIFKSVSFVTVKHLSDKHLREMYIPLPPLAEQKRIVEKIEELFKHL